MTQPPPTRASHWFSPQVCDDIRRAIADNDGREVFFIGRVEWDEDHPRGIVSEVEAHAFGAQNCVPALKRLCRPGDVIIHNHPSGDLAPSEADVSLASAMADLDVANFIVDNACRRVHVLVKPHPPQKLTHLDPDRIEQHFVPGGVLARNLPRSFEHRPEQVRMARAVAQAFNENKIALIEAGTGVGKSFAYLIPAIFWAVINRERVVISTNTINLQEQLIRNDIPLLRELLGVEFEAVLLKGRSNYLGLRKARFVQTQTGLFPPDEELRTIFEWMERTTDGSLSDLPIRPRDEVWEKVVSETDNCLRLKCPEYENCFFFKARRTAARAQLIVVNHHLLMSDLSIRAASQNYSDTCVLPPFRRLIIDEAHNLEDVATSYLSIEFTHLGLERILGRFQPRRSPEKGLFAFLGKMVFQHQADLPAERRDEVMRLIKDELPAMRADLSDATGFVMEQIAEHISGLFPGQSFEPGRTYQLRITPDVAASELFQTLILDGARQIGEAIANLASRADYFLMLVKSLPWDRHESLRDAMMEFRSQLDKLTAQGERIMAFVESKKGLCRWLDYTPPRQQGRKPLVRFCSAPIDIGAKLRRALFKPLKTVVLTSATLTVDRSFAFIRSRVGLEIETPAHPDETAKTFDPSAGEQRAGPPPENEAAESAAAPAVAKPTSRHERSAEAPDALFVLKPHRLLTLLLDSPFRFQEQALVAVPTDLPSPEHPDFPGRLPEILIRTVEHTKGRALILFTAYSLLDSTFAAAAPAIEALGCRCLRQGSASRHVLLQQFKSDVSSVLFATSSFWEGVDVPGDALQCVVITRLPFRVPTEPIWQARIEELEREERDAFMELTVPLAVMKFRQGFGRLIRRRDDRGVVLVLDNRVIHKRYGQVFLRSLPPCPVIRKPFAEIAAQIGEFIGSGPAQPS
ncbi:MAG: hypothetical protein Kow0059_15520 [Candidatus Sumerlaeia bacterium]